MSPRRPTKRAGRPDSAARARAGGHRNTSEPPPDSHGFDGLDDSEVSFTAPDAPPVHAGFVGLHPLLGTLLAAQPYERPYDPDAPTPEPGLGVQRAIHRAFGLTDPVKIEVRVLITTPPGESKAMADALRDDARWGLSTHATAAEVNAKAVRILHEMAGLVPPRWGPYPPDVAGEATKTGGSRAAEPPDQRLDSGTTSDAPSGTAFGALPGGARPQRTRRRRQKGAE